ncbi:hypothetical protein LC55x_2876 [Lysobacter capsici]|nr:hypothetical protein LC55x_2876 [Lysobacter capsici]
MHLRIPETFRLAAPTLPSSRDYRARVACGCCLRATTPPATRPPTVIPAKVGIQRLQSPVAVKPWIPAFAGMTSTSKGRAVRNFIWPAYYPAVIPANAGMTA